MSLLGHAETAAFPWINLMTSGSRTEIKQVINKIIKKIYPRAARNPSTIGITEGQNIQRSNNNINAIAPI